MEITKLKETDGRTSSIPLKPDVLLSRLSQLGAIQAQVLSISKGQAMLATPLGRILTANALDLTVGDRLNIRADSGGIVPKLKVSKSPPEPALLDVSAHKSLARSLTAGKLNLAIVSSQSPAATLIKMANQLIEIPPKPDLPVGQLISLLKSTKGNSIELSLLNHQQVLKSAIKQLIPQAVNTRETAITGIMVLLRNLRSTSGQHFASTISDKQASQLSGDKKQSSDLPGNKTPSLLDSLIKSTPRLRDLGRLNIQQWLDYSLSFPKASNDSPATKSSPFQVLTRLAESETQAFQQIKQLFSESKVDSNSKLNHSTQKGINEEALQLIGRDLFRLAEQSVSQQLLQQANLRLQQELQQPLAFNISIPITDNDNIAELRLKIQQRKSESEHEGQAWDIHFDFEFGLLGYISTHLLLQEQTLSASFWSLKPETQQQIETSLDDFQQQIVHAGLTPGRFHSFHGRPPQPDIENPIQIADSLLDIRV